MEDLQEQMTSLSNRLLAARQEEPSGSQHAFIAQSIPLFARLKALHRDASLQALAAKASAAQHRSSMDAASLELQNLVYEKQHLEQEITKCRDYLSVYQEVPLHEEEDYRQMAQAQEKEVPDATSDPHAHMLARLQFELEERQRLEAVKKELLAQKSKLTKDNADKKNALDVVDKQLEEFITSAKEIQQNMTLV